MSKQYRNYFYVTIFTSLAVTVLYCAAVYSLWPWIDTETCARDDCIVLKERLASEIGLRPKIVFGGGSATSAGVGTEDVQKAFGVPTVNMGLHGGLEIDYLLYRIKRVLSKGDVVILPLEYDHFVYTGKSSSFKASFVASCDREYFRKLPLRSRVEYVFSLIGFKTVLEALKSRRSRGTRECTTPYNGNGDATSNVGEPPWFKEPDYERSPVPIQREGFAETRGLVLIKEFSRWCKARGIRCYISYANLLYQQDYANETYRIYFCNLQNYFIKNDIAFIGTPYDFFFPRKFFYDTRYHLNREGVTLRTRQLIAMMRKMNIVPRP